LGFVFAAMQGTGKWFLERFDPGDFALEIGLWQWLLYGKTW